MANSYILQMGKIWEYSNASYNIMFPGESYLRKGISRLYEALTTGDYAGTTNITVNGKTEAKTNNCVQDLRTGLMWCKSYSQSVGPASNGKLYWDDRVDRITFSNNAGDDFSAGTVVTQSGSGATALIRYTVESRGNMAVESVENGPFTVSAASLTAGSSGPADCDSFAEGSAEDVFEYVRQANLAGLAGYSDWRIPNINELASIMYFDWANGTAKPDSTYFSVIAGNDGFWTSNPDSNHRGYFAVAFETGLGGWVAGTSSEKSFDTYYVYLVRGPVDPNSRRCLPLRTDLEHMGINFFDDGWYRLGVEKSFTVLEAGQYSGTTSFYLYDGTSEELSNKCVLDDNTDLMWLYEISDNTYPYYDTGDKRGDALEFLRLANLYAVGGHNDWRIPNAFEHLSVYDAHQERVRSQVSNSPGSSAWLSTHRPSSLINVHYTPLGRPWSYSGDHIATGGPYYVRLVRGGKTDDDL